MTLTKDDSADQALVTTIPGFGVGSCDIFGRFAGEVRRLQQPEQVLQFVKRWRAFWIMGQEHKAPHVAVIDLQITACQFDPAEALKCIRRVRGGQMPCAHVDPGPIRSKKQRARKKHFKKVDALRVARGHSLCVGMEIFLPWSLLQAMQISHYYGVPDGCAIHQAFCDAEDHGGCF